MPTFASHKRPLLADFVAKGFCGMSRATLIRHRAQLRNFDSLNLRF
jgi:hypothetical protein